MSATAVRDAADYESRLQQYYFERAEEARAVRVGEKDVSEQAAIDGVFFGHKVERRMKAIAFFECGNLSDELLPAPKYLDGGL